MGTPVKAEFDAEKVRNLVRSLLAGDLPSRDLKRRDGDCLVTRVFLDDDHSVIAKLWNRPGLRGALRRWSGTDPLQKEIRPLQYLGSAGLSVPDALGSARLRDPDVPFTLALILEDLGDCQSATEHVKRLISDEREAELDTFLDDVLKLTRAMLDLGVVDIDHSFLNLVATPSGDVARLDFELAEKQHWREISDEKLGKMVGWMLGTYMYAVQPEVERVHDLGRRAAEVLDLNQKARRHARAKLHEVMAYQLRTSGIDTKVELPWDESGNWPSHGVEESS